MAVDIPIGLSEAGLRAADLGARRFVGPRWRSVFLTPPRAAIEAAAYPEAAAASRRLTGAGLSQQIYGLQSKILEADAFDDNRIHEVHPEVTFRAIVGKPLALGKKTGGEPCRCSGRWRRCNPVRRRPPIRHRSRIPPVGVVLLLARTP